MENPNAATGEDEFFITGRVKVNNGEKKKDIYSISLRKDVGALSQGTILEQKRGEMRLAQEDLNKKRKQYEEQEQVWKNREEMLQKKKKEFYDKIQDMKSFTKQTANKIERYTEKAKEEKVQNEIKEKQIYNLKEHLETLTKKRNKLEKELDKVMECQKYLESVLKVESSFDEIDKIIKRYETLSTANKELVMDIENFKNENKETSHLYKTFSKEGQNTIFELNSTLAQTRNRFEKLKSVNDKEESNLRTLEDVSIKTSQLLGQVIMSINNLYSRCHDSKRGQIFLPEDNYPITLLDFIKTRIDDLQFIIGQLQTNNNSTQ